MQKINLIVSIDTECDKSLNWSVPQPLTFKNIEDQKCTLFPMFDKFGIKATYLLSPEVMNDNESVSIFKDRGGLIELGTHLHSEFIEPQSNVLTTSTNEVQLELDSKVEFQKIKNLTELFVEKFGVRPMSFRSGRFGASPATLRILADLGYKVDSSFKPYSRLYFRNKKYVDYWGIKHNPFFPSFQNYKKKSKQRKILEIPVSIIQPNLTIIPFFILSKMGIPKNFALRALKKMNVDLKQKWLRPGRHGLNELEEITDWIVKNASESTTPILNIMFHSNEITANASPYCETKEDVEKYLKSLENYFEMLYKKYNVQSIGLSDSHSIYA